MKIIKSLSELEEWVSHSYQRGLRIGLVPTMGALHEGHLSLVRRARKENDLVAVSIFVNPTQFNNPTDLETYPRDEERDFRLLAPEGTDMVFAPSVSEIYPSGAVREKIFDLGAAAEVMEGPRRPGHFQGVAQIVSRLFELIRPHNAYFGEKDFQQIAVIRNMVASEKMDVNIIACPIRRADDGLALSSRNALLTPEQRAVAPSIYRHLQQGVDYSHSHGVSDTRAYVEELINAEPEMKVEYFEIVDGRTLQPIEEWGETDYSVGCITVYCGKVRLIDNIAFRLPAER
ncbi:MAG: pantoate--beta-alanine ligase [Bacteroides sp.]|nr:pantoate--beta-alanine ligase [Bacteroides sp.]